MADEPVLIVRNLSKSFGDLQVLKSINMTISKGTVYGILGPSGSGKSTLLRCINHIEVPSGGYVRVNGELIGYTYHDGALHGLSEKKLARQRTQMGMVFQDFNLFPHLRVLDNVTLAPIIVLGMRRADAEQKARMYLERVGLSDKIAAYPETLSGGQQQRVAIARALAMDPTLILFDEPTSALDPELVGEVLDTIRELAEQGMTMLIVTHHIGFVGEVADEVYMMDKGRVIEHGAAKAVLGNPQDARTKEFLSRAN